MQLYTYFRSSAAYRVRIALNLKGLTTDMIPIHLQKQGGMNKKPEYRAINPQMRVPALKLEQFLPYRLNVVASIVSQALSRIYADRYGIGVPEWRVLVTLGQFGMMTGKAIGAHSHMHKTKVSRAVAQLEERKFLTRRPNRADLRESFLSLTPAGRAVYEELAPSALAFMDRLAEVVAAVDRPAFDRAMKQLTKRSAELVAEAEDGKT